MNLCSYLILIKFITEKFWQWNHSMYTTLWFFFGQKLLHRGNMPNYIHRIIRTNSFLDYLTFYWNINSPTTQHVSTRYLSISHAWCARSAKSTLSSFTYRRFEYVSKLSKRNGSQFCSWRKVVIAVSTSECKIKHIIQLKRKNLRRYDNKINRIR
jgi:hypothetical protein